MNRARLVGTTFLVVFPSLAVFPTVGAGQGPRASPTLFPAETGPAIGPRFTVPDTLQIGRSEAEDTLSEGDLVFAGAVLGGGGGLALGALAGVLFEKAIGLPPEDQGPGSGPLYGAGLGTILGVPTVIHLVNGRQGDFPRAVGVSAAVTFAGFALLFANGENSLTAPILVAIPLVEAVLATKIELETAKSPGGFPPLR